MAKKKQEVAPAHDYSAYANEDVPMGGNIMARLGGLAAEQLQVEARVMTLEAELKQTKETLRHICENKMPTLMEEAGQEDCTVTGGIRIKIKSIIRGSIPANNAKEAFTWLEDNGNGNLIKREFKIDFGKDDDKWADKFERDLKQRKKPLNVKRKKAVHPGTLQAFVREQLEMGVPIPMDVFGVYRQNYSSVTVKT